MGLHRGAITFTLLLFALVLCRFSHDTAKISQTQDIFPLFPAKYVNDFVSDSLIFKNCHKVEANILNS